MILLDLNSFPHYYSSNVRQFLPHEKHIERFFKQDVLILMYKGILRFEEDGIPVELTPGQYYIQTRGKHQKGTIESDCPNYYYIHFLGAFHEDGHLPLSGTFDIPKMQALTENLEKLELNALQTGIRAAFLRNPFRALLRGKNQFGRRKHPCVPDSALYGKNFR